MSKQLQITQAKPNPIGKDKTSSGLAKPEQLLGEWVDVRNVGTEAIRFSSMTVSHTLYNDRCQTTGRTEDYWSGSDKELLPGQVIRIHTGRISDEHLMAAADRQGVDWHDYANRDNFVLNNRCGDRITVTWLDGYGRRVSDAAYYRPNPPEGVVLRRHGDALEPVSAAFRY
jgi:hypothetical protein